MARGRMAVYFGCLVPWHGMARRGEARHGSAGHGAVWPFVCWLALGLGTAWRGKARHGQARQGAVWPFCLLLVKARRGWAWRGTAR
jgi:hypothetical protein